MITAGVRVLGIVIVVLAACGPSPEEQAVQRWLLCDECTRGELDTVVALGDTVTPLLLEALKGPSQRNREYIRRQAVERYRGLRSPGIALAAFVGHYDSNFVAHYQSNAAIALGRIGTPPARAALFQAMRNDSNYSDDVLRSISTAAPLDLALAAGAAQAAPPDSFVRVNPTVVARDATTGQPLAGVKVVFTVDSGRGRVSDSMVRTGPDGQSSVRWALGPGPDSFNVLRATVFRRSVLFNATAHGLTPRLVFTVPPSNATQGRPMAPTVHVVALDAWDQRVTTLSGTAEAVVVGGSGSGLVRPFVAGQTEFPDFVPTFRGTGFLKVAVTGATPVISQPFNVAQ